MSKGLLDTVSAAKFMRAIAGNQNIRVSFIQGLKVPTASASGSIRLAPPTIESLDKWMWDAHHELSHCMPSNLYHFDTLKMITKGKTVLNIISDNLAERCDYDRYEGRRMILSGERQKFMTNDAKDWFTDKPLKTKEDVLIFGLIAWDCLDRAKWMGFPMSTFRPETTRFQEVLDYLEEIELTKLVDNCRDAYDLLTITNKILDYIHETDSDEEDSSGSGEEKEDLGTTIEEWDDANVSEETKEVVEEYIPNSNPAPESDQPYQPFSEIKWYPLNDVSDNINYSLELKEQPHHVRAFLESVSDVESITGNSKVSKSIQKYLQAMNQCAYQGGLKAGKISPSSVYKTASGGVDIFRKRIASRIQKDTAIQVLMDCSGSMCSSCSTPQKLTIAQASCSILGDTLNQLTVPYEIIGFTHTKDVGVQMFEFKSFSENIKKAMLVKRMCSVPWCCDNADAESVLEGASRINQRGEGNKIMIVLSDGHPAAYFEPSQWAAEQYLKQVCGHIEEDTNIDLLSIGINSTSVEKFYKNHTVIYNPSQLDGVLMELLKNKLV